MSKIKDAQMNFILDEATKLFFEKSITSVTMSDIASEIGVGEATLYRYFGKKQNLVIKVAERLSSNLLEKYFSFSNDKNGYENIKEFYEAYLKIFIDNKSYYAFVYSLDAYLHNESQLNLDLCNVNIKKFKDLFISSYQKGIEDKSLKDDIDLNLFYRTTAISLLSFCKKLAIEDILIEDKDSNQQLEIKQLIDLFLFRIKQ